MNSSRLYSAHSTRSPKHIGPVTRKMLHERTCEIARLAGRAAPHVTQDDYEQAKRDLTGDPYALIIDTTIDDQLSDLTQSSRYEPSAPPEAASSLSGHLRGGVSSPGLFFQGNCPLPGVT